MFFLRVKSTEEFGSASFKSIATFYHQYLDKFYFGGSWQKRFVKNRKNHRKTRKITWYLDHAIDSYVFQPANQPCPDRMAERD